MAEPFPQQDPRSLFKAQAGDGVVGLYTNDFYHTLVREAFPGMLQDQTSVISTAFKAPPEGKGERRIPILL